MQSKYFIPNVILLSKFCDSENSSTCIANGQQVRKNIIKNILKSLLLIKLFKFSTHAKNELSKTFSRLLKQSFSYSLRSFS